MEALGSDVASWSWRFGAWVGRPSASLDTPGAGIPPGPGSLVLIAAQVLSTPRRETMTRAKKRSERHLFPTRGWTVRLSSQAAQEFCSLRSWMEADLSQNLAPRCAHNSQPRGLLGEARLFMAWHRPLTFGPQGTFLHVCSISLAPKRGKIS